MKRCHKYYQALFSSTGWMILKTPIVGMERVYDDDAVSAALQCDHRFKPVVIVSYDKLRQQFTDEEIDDLCQAPPID